MEDAIHVEATSPAHGGSSWKVSVNERIGGTGGEPTPGDLLLAALASCQTLTLKMTAAALGVRLTSLVVVAEGDIDHRGVLLMDPNVRPGFTEIRLHVRVEAPGADPDRLRRVLEAASRSCAATDALRNGAPIQVSQEIV
jgi:uncharacterized OsmC-like protein